MTEHIARSFDEDLRALRRHTVDMASAVRGQLDALGRALLNLDEREAQSVVEGDRVINRREMELDAMVETLFSRRQPQAVDLRVLLATVRFSTDLERIGDEIRTAAKSVRKLGGELSGPLGEVRGDLLKIHALLCVMTDETVESLSSYDDSEAEGMRARSWLLDREVHELLLSIVECLKAGTADVGQGLELIRAAQAMRRVSSHLENVAESLVFIRRGVDIRHDEAESLP